MEISITQFDDLVVAGYPGDYIFETIRQSGKYYENDTLDKWLPVLRDSNTILDIGSNLGNHSLYWAKRLQNVVIYSFEPYKDNFKCLLENVEANGLAGRVFPLNMAVGETEGYAEVSSSDQSNLGGTTFVMSSESTDNQVVSADGFIVQNDIANIGFVKIDTEGFELLVLKGMTELLKKYQPIVWVEVSYESYRDVGAFLGEYGYKLIDYSGFNMLYAISCDLSFHLEDFTEAKVFDEMLKYLDKTNFYYKAYNTAKKWVEDKDTALNKSREKYREAMTVYDRLKKQYEDIVARLSAANNKYRESTEAYDKLNGQYKKLIEEYNDVSEKYAGLQKQHAFMKSLNVEYAEELTVNVATAQQDILLLQNLRSTLGRQQSQINALKQENQEYRRKLSIITDSWYGKILTKCYRLIKKAYTRIRPKKGRGA